MYVPMLPFHVLGGRLDYTEHLTLESKAIV